MIWMAGPACGWVEAPDAAAGGVVVVTMAMMPSVVLMLIVERQIAGETAPRGASAPVPCPAGPPHCGLGTWVGTTVPAAAPAQAEGEVCTLQW